jgi:hypothetical protein
VCDIRRSFDSGPASEAGLAAWKENGLLGEAFYHPSLGPRIPPTGCAGFLWVGLFRPGTPCIPPAGRPGGIPNKGANVSYPLAIAAGRDLNPWKLGVITHILFGETEHQSRDFGLHHGIIGQVVEVADNLEGGGNGGHGWHPDC